MILVLLLKQKINTSFMKKLFILVALFAGISIQMFSQASAMQNCHTPGVTSIAPQTGTHPFGLSPSDSLLPCAVQGVAVNDTIYFTNLTTTLYSGLTVTIDSLTIDSIYTPSGLCWQTNSPTNTFRGGANGVIHVTGVTNDSAGQYKLRIIATVVGTAFGITQTQTVNGESEGLIYKIRVRGPYCNCPTIDNSRADSTDVYIAYAACPPTATITPSGHDTICPSNSVTLTADTGNSYTYRWSDAAHSTTRSISVSTAGAYQVTVYQGADSVVSTPTTIVVSSTPSATLTLHGPSAICPGATDTITAAAGYTYHWNAAGGNATTQSINVTSAGSYIVTVTNSNGCTAVSSPEVITNSGSCGSTPVAIITPAGHDTICPGDSVTLTATSGLGYTFKWSNAAHSTTQSITVSTGGAYTVTVYNSPDSAISAPTTIVVASAPGTGVTLTGPNTFCQGDSTMLTAAAGLSYHWSNSATTQSIVVSTTGNYSVTVTNANGCSAVSSPQSITVNTLQPDTITRTGLFLTSSQVETSYQWYKASTLLTGETTATYMATQNGTYTLAYTDANGCHGVSNSITITGVGINEVISNLVLNVYPNPSEGIFSLVTTGCEGSYYEITDDLGRTVQKKLIMADNTLVDMSNQNGGIYYLTVRNGQQQGTIRFVVLNK